MLADYALQGGAANGCSALQRGRERRAGDGRCFGLPASIDDLDRSGELLVGLRQIRAIKASRVLRPLPVLRRRHQERYS